ncbi:MAG: hypothetical protein JW969_01875, partial [Spirochaetales bacterium]|nr:hypothetical protein [Spirochaetales bacterium]
MKKISYMASIIVCSFVLALCTSDRYTVVEFNNDNYSEDWKKVSEMESKALPKSMLEIVDSIFEKAKKENNPGQFIKAVVYKIKYLAQVEEGSLVKSILAVQEEAVKAAFPEKQILYSLLAEIYWGYYENNRYHFYNRTETVNFEQDDINTWSLKKIVEECVNCYTLSLEEPGRLKGTRIGDFAAVLNHTIDYIPNGRERRPTLYDFLAHRAVDFFMRTEPDITRPADTFALNDERYFSRASDFINVKITSEDPLSYKYHALSLFRDLTGFHLRDREPAALVDVELKRLEFVLRNYTGEKKDELYLNALDTLLKSSGDSTVAAEILYHLADYHYGKASGYNPQVSADYKDEAGTAYGICEDAIKNYPGSIGAGQCAYLKDRITEKNLSMVIENMNLPEKPFKGLVEYRNLDRIFVKIYKTSEWDLETIYDEQAQSYEKTGSYRDYNSVLIDFFKTKKESASFDVDLPDDKDYNGHNVEIKLPSLPVGYYAFLAGSSADLSYDHNAVVFAFSHVSSISYIHRTEGNGDLEFQMLDRQTGDPLAGVKARVYVAQYNSRKSRNEYIKSTVYSSDKNGRFAIPAGRDYKNFGMEFTYKNDTLTVLTSNDRFGQAVFYQGRKRDEGGDRESVQAMVFTDRAIYRPGQAVYFKALLMKSDDRKKFSVLNNTKAIVELYDVNWRKVAEKSLTTNSFGSINGFFTAPLIGITGQMQIAVKRAGKTVGYKYISVEEYKRPKFEVLFEPLKGTYRLGDEVAAKGTAISYSGAAVTGAKVKYRVVRSAVFPYWWYYYYGYYPRSPEMEISHGSSVTGDTGLFEIKFSAIPDAAVSRDSKPVFTYRIYADVTDINGETHSQMQYIRLGYHALLIGLYSDEYLDRDKNNGIEISVTNLMGEPEKSDCNVRIFRLKEPGKYFRERFWKRPDKFLFSHEEYRALFPDDVYDDENNHYKWEKDKEVYNGKVAVEDRTKIKLDGLEKWPAGEYIIEAETRDRFGQDIKEARYFTLYSGKDEVSPYPAASLFIPDKTSAEPGENLNLLAGGLAEQVLFEIEYDSAIMESRFLSCGLSSKTGHLKQTKLTIPIKEEYRGNITLYLTFVQNNRLYSKRETIIVPYTNKQLAIKFETFRSKLLPGEKEEWRLKISGPKKEKVAAEMVATLYDASLDAFRANYFDFSVYPYFYGGRNWDSTRGFSVNNGRLYSVEWNGYASYSGVDYDRFNWFDLYFFDVRGDR